MRFHDDGANSRPEFVISWRKVMPVAGETDKWEFYKDASGEWRWRRTAPNGNIVGRSSQGYVNKADCEANARRNGWKG